MKTILRHKGIGGLLFAQTQVAFNDNATKLALIGLVQMLLPADAASRVVSLIALLLVTPFVLFAPVSGWLSDRFPKRNVLSASLWLQLAVMVALVGAAAIRSLPVAVGGFFLLGIQSSLMSPARRGMIKELAGESVGEVVGWMEMFCIAAILAGSLAGGQLIDGLAASAGGPWQAAGISFVLLAVSCAVAIWFFRRVPAHASSNRVPFGLRVVFGHGALIQALRRDPGIRRAAWGDAVFYLAGGFLLLTLSEAGRALFPGGLGAARMTGLMLATMGAGIAVGSVSAARICRYRIIMGLVPVSAMGLAGVLFVLANLKAGGFFSFAGLFALGVCGGLYLVPLGAFLVDRAPEEHRGSILAGSSMLSSIAGVLAVALHALVAGVCHFGLHGQFLCLSVLFFLTAIFATSMLPQDVLRIVTFFLARWRYDVRNPGFENIPSKGGVLMVCNHVTYVDTIVLSLASPRPIRFLSYDAFFQALFLGKILRIFGAIPVSSTKARDAIVRASDCIRAGEVVCIFPEGQLTRTGCLMELKSGFELIARRAQCPVVVAHLDGLWGSIYSFEGGRYFTKCPHRLRRNVTVSFAKPLSVAEATASRVRETLLELGEQAFRARPLKRTLASCLIRTLDSEPWKIAIHDPVSRPKMLRRGELLAGGRLLARRLRSMPQRRIGILLPPGIPGTLANLAVILAGKVPVNLNPTLTPEAARSCLELAGLQAVITAEAVVKKIPNFPWPDNLVFIERELKGISSVSRAWTWLEGLVLHAFLIERRMRLPRVKPDDEAIVLFTSGTSGLPKGVSLSHRQVMGNFHQVCETGFLRPDDRLLSALPLFHSFGLTMGMLAPLMSGRTLITSPSPLDCEKLADAARECVATVLLTTPTFLRAYARRIPRDAFGTLRLAATGAERLPAETAAAFRSRFGCEVFAGYGLTEAAPVMSFNMPDPARGFGADSLQKGWREGSTGRLLPGVAMRLLDPETGEECPGGSRGVLAVRGANIISAYLDGQSPEKFRDGWLVTGDIVRVDAEGFLFLEGRLSRFSKVGGEMVSHGAVEEAIARAFPDSTGRAHDCVLGRPSIEKGEELVLLTTRDLTREDLCRELDVPNLWIPRHVLHLDHLPILITGKLDLAACRALVNDAAAVA
ncbi:MAG: MFS transporter [Verrucomicrobia bacterium]|nr:MFS transporter [Verrucomicrobiota bacterium]